MAEIRSGEEWLQLLEEQEHQLALDVGCQLIEGSLTDILAEVGNPKRLRVHGQDVLPLLQDVVEEFCHEQSSKLVLLVTVLELLLQGQVVAVELLVRQLGRLHLGVDALELAFQIVDHPLVVQLLIGIRIALFIDVFVEIDAVPARVPIDLLLQLCDLPLEVVAPLRQLLLDLLVDVDLSLQLLDRHTQLVVSLEHFLGLLRRRY